jgi:hypothetical protein
MIGRATFRQRFPGVTFHEQRDEVADWSALVSGVFLYHDALNFGWFDLFVGRDKSAEDFVDDLLFGQRDHTNQYAHRRESCPPDGWRRWTVTRRRVARTGLARIGQRLP